MRIFARPLDEGTKLEITFCLYGEKNSDDTVPTREIVEVMSNAEWVAFKRLSDKKKIDMIKRVGSTSNTEEVLVGNSPLLDDDGKSSAEYDADFNVDENGNFVWAI